MKGVSGRQEEGEGGTYGGVFGVEGGEDGGEAALFEEMGELRLGVSAASMKVGGGTYVLSRQLLHMPFLHHEHLLLPLLDEIESLQRTQRRLDAIDPKHRSVPRTAPHLGHATAHEESGIERSVQDVAELGFAESCGGGRGSFFDERGRVDVHDFAEGGESVAEGGGRGEGCGGGLESGSLSR